MASIFCVSTLGQVLTGNVNPSIMAHDEAATVAAALAAKILQLQRERGDFLSTVVIGNVQGRYRAHVNRCNDFYACVVTPASEVPYFAVQVTSLVKSLLAAIGAADTASLQVSVRAHLLFEEIVHSDCAADPARLTGIATILAARGPLTAATSAALFLHRTVGAADGGGSDGPGASTAPGGPNAASRSIVSKPELALLESHFSFPDDGIGGGVAEVRFDPQLHLGKASAAGKQTPSFSKGARGLTKDISGASLDGSGVSSPAAGHTPPGTPPAVAVVPPSHSRAPPPQQPPAQAKPRTVLDDLDAMFSGLAAPTPQPQPPQQALRSAAGIDDWLTPSALPTSASPNMPRAAESTSSGAGQLPAPQHELTGSARQYDAAPVDLFGAPSTVGDNSNAPAFNDGNHNTGPAAVAVQQDSFFSSDYTAPPRQPEDLPSPSRLVQGEGADSAPLQPPSPQLLYGGSNSQQHIPPASPPFFDEPVTPAAMQSQPELPTLAAPRSTANPLGDADDFWSGTQSSITSSSIGQPPSPLKEPTRITVRLDQRIDIADDGSFIAVTEAFVDCDRMVPKYWGASTFVRVSMATESGADVQCSVPLTQLKPGWAVPLTLPAVAVAGDRIPVRAQISASHLAEDDALIIKARYAWNPAIALPTALTISVPITVSFDEITARPEESSTTTRNEVRWEAVRDGQELLPSGSWLAVKLTGAHVFDSAFVSTSLEWRTNALIVPVVVDVCYENGTPPAPVAYVAGAPAESSYSGLYTFSAASQPNRATSGE
jgi:hypothetical protein